MTSAIAGAAGAAGADAAIKAVAASPLAQWAGTIANLSATGVVFWIVIVLMPQAQTLFHEELSKEREMYRTEMKEMRQTFSAAIEKLTDAIEK